jgi:hypothetical protein
LRIGSDEIVYYGSAVGLNTQPERVRLAAGLLFSQDGIAESKRGQGEA